MAKHRQTASDTKVVAIAAAADGHPLTNCRMCGSTRRGAYEVSSVQDIDGKRHAWLRCRCLACGQARVDRVMSDIPPACGFVPPEPGFAGCTRERGHDGPCAHPTILTDAMLDRVLEKFPPPPQESERV